MSDSKSKKSSSWHISVEYDKELKEAYKAASGAYEAFKKATGISIDFKFSIGSPSDTNDIRYHKKVSDKSIQTCPFESQIRKTIEDCKNSKLSPESMKYIHSEMRDTGSYTDNPACDELFINAIKDAQNDWQ